MKTQLNFISTPAASLQGSIQVPGDKSISHRALMLAAIANGTSKIQGLLCGADNLATLAALRELGVDIDLNGDCAIVKGVGLYGLKAPQQALDLGNSGTGMRLLAGLLAGQRFDSELIGDASLSQRPMQRIVDPLAAMGAKITATKNGTPPLKIRGQAPLNAFQYALPIASAQVKSAILLAGLYAEGKTTVIQPAASRDHLECLLRAFGCSLDVYGLMVSLDGGHELQAINIQVPGDISSAAFFMVAASINPGSKIILKRVGVNPTRTGIIDILKLMGAHIHLTNFTTVADEAIADIEVCYAPLTGIKIPAELVPLAIDEFPIILIAAASAKGETILTNARELRVKETDRIEAMHLGLKALGIDSETLDDGIKVRGGQFTRGKVDSFHDHRIAMAFAIAGSIASGPVVISDCDNVATSFPNFTQLASQLGMQLEAQ
ncbi:MAG: 3-phosphoshikimate 1-carboxyvinyltransferase [Gammaproteobacteria bacterium]|nr:3-phosphoshikimate 1-carboxyvinyltransferase [Gammaproteobacteria bacterium]